MNPPIRPSPFAQFLGMVRYEALMHWRQRMLLASAIVITLVSITIIASIRPDSIDRSLTYTDEVKLRGSTAILNSLQPMLLIFSMILLPITVADAIPQDRRYRVREMLDTLPLSTSVYLWGKLGGVLLITALCMCIPLATLGIVWWFAMYPFEIPSYLGMAFLTVIPVSLINSSISVLISAGQPSRRRALLWGVAVAIALVMLMSAGLTRSIGWIDLLNPGKPLLFKYYLISLVNEGGARGLFEPITPTHVFLTLGAAIVELGALWFIMRGVLNRAEAHSGRIN